MKRKFSEILLIDDDQITNYITQELLLDMHVGDKIMVQQSGKDALDYIKGNWLPAKREEVGTRLILLDLNMPLMSGFEFLDHFSAFQMKDVRIFVLTTSESSRDVEKASQYKIEGYLVKPLETNPAFVEEMQRQLAIE